MADYPRSDKDPDLWRLTFYRGDAEEHAHELIGLGVGGVEVRGPDRLVCYVAGAAAAAQDFSRRAAAAGFTLSALEPAERRNWVQACRALWTPLEIGRLRVMPVLEPDASTDRSHDAEMTVRMVPGEAFGTGHHASTRLALELLQHPEIEARPPHRVLDAGAGSAVLAIACAKLYPSCVAALDIDPSVMANARLNLGLNGLTGRAVLAVGTLHAVAGAFDLIAANIYAEVLMALEPRLAELLRPEGRLILSGIMDSKWAALAVCFAPPRWRCLAKLEADGWTAALLEAGSLRFTQPPAVTV